MQKKTAFFLFMLVVLIWGINWTITKLIVLEVSPLWSNALRSAIAAFALLILQLATKQFIVPTKRDLPAILVVSVFHMTIFASLMAVGLQFTSVGRSVMLGYTTPLWVTPAAIFFLREPVHILRLVGVILGIMGVGILFFPAVMGLQSAELGEHAFIGNILLLIASFSWAITIVGIKKVAWHASSFQLVFWQLLVATILSACVAFMWEGVPQVTWTASLGWLLAYSGILGTAFGFWAMTVVNRHLSAIVTSLGLLATPMVGIAFSLYLLGESLDIPLIVAGLCIFVGIGLGAYEKKTS